jgi:hypothetical protein
MWPMERGRDVPSEGFSNVQPSPGPKLYAPLKIT